MNDLEKIVFKYVLLNASQHKGKANPKAVIGSIMANESELRSKGKEISQIAGDIVEKVNSMSVEEQIEELNNLGLEKTDKKRKQVKSKGLDGLPGSHDNVVMRFAPNPSGPLHIGHARAAVPNREYVKRYNGKLILRIEDTDPKRVYLPAYDMIQEDLKWLGVNFDEIYYQSDRFPIYYEYAVKLIEMGGAYMCTCDGDSFKKLKDDSMACSCRDLSAEENLKRWEKFHLMNAGDAVLRVKTDIKHKNPAIRDWVAMRLVDEEHPRIGNKYRVYPMMNFSVAIDDHLMGMTYVLRGKDHLANSEKQKYLYQHFQWDVPEFIHYGRLKMEDIALSTSNALKGIENGQYSGWDDPRLGTLRAIGRRGVKAKTIHDLMIEIGVKMSDSAISWKKIYGLNRNYLEKEANRYFFVENPKLVKITDFDVKDVFSKNNLNNNSVIIERPLHPDFIDRGNRKLVLSNEVYLAGVDFKNGLSRLMDGVNIDINLESSDNPVVYSSKSFEEAKEKKMRIIQWVPATDPVKTKIVLSDNSTIEGLSESACKNLKIGDIVQFERVGFARLDEIKDYTLIFYFAHK
ncbi:glutamate--tRNA ligase [Methanobrevibacter curvatus]|uniref:Glutamate--tRNA ligase n=1 Tax=Methanobrevibacter curvatus TaxID=49547 RepID=A0A166CKX6_9EURY|nr:glutamate--tRNA ligase [Methanobrevibacter curvatus]KZX15137.1 glutamine--tRNA ligase [Methanobrevibacter curvatus]